MSLILEALRKIEREKRTPEQGFLVVGQAGWPAHERPPRVVLGAAALALVGVGVGVGYWLERGSSPAQTTASGAATASPAAAPSTGLAPTASSLAPIDSPVRPERREAATRPTEGLGSRPPVEVIRAERRAPSAPSAAGDLDPQAAESEQEATAGEDSSAPGTRTRDAREPAQAPPTNSETALARAEAPSSAELRLQAIAVRDGRPIALINDRLVREGDAFDGVKVIRIGATEVEIEVDGRRRTLTF